MKFTMPGESNSISIPISIPLFRPANSSTAATATSSQTERNEKIPQNSPYKASCQRGLVVVVGGAVVRFGAGGQNMGGRFSLSLPVAAAPNGAHKINI